MSSVLWRFNVKLGELIFQNQSGLLGNISGRLNLLLCRSSTDVDRTTDIDSHGFSKVDIDVDNETKMMENSLQELVDSNEVSEKGHEGQTLIYEYGSQNENFDIEKIKGVESAVNRIRLEVESYFGSYFKPVYVNLRRYPERDDSDYFARSWHMDQYSPDHIRIFVLLTDAAKGRGSSCFVTREDSKKALKQVEGNFKQDGRVWEDLDKNHFYGEKGSTALADPVQHFHRGTNPKDHRDIAIITVRPSKTPLEENWVRNAELIEKPSQMMNANSLMDTLGLK